MDSTTTAHEALVECAHLPSVQVALIAACQRAAATGARVGLCLVAYRAAASRTEPLLADAARIFRGDDVVASCRQGLVVVTGPFTHPADAEKCAHRLREAMPHDPPAVGLAIFPNHGETVDRLISSAVSALGRIREHDIFE